MAIQYLYDNNEIVDIRNSVITTATTNITTSTTPAISDIIQTPFTTTSATPTTLPTDSVPLAAFGILTLVFVYLPSFVKVVGCPSEKLVISYLLHYFQANPTIEALCPEKQWDALPKVSFTTGSMGCFLKRFSNKM